jgi:hypothetical protein
MKAFGIIPLVLAAAAAGAQTTNQSQIRHVETSLNHLTVLEFGEPVTTLAIADPDSFQIERHDDKVFVKPLKDGVSTNLFVWTASRELSYELDPAGQLSAMDVLVRTVPATNSRTTAEAAAEPSDAEIRKIASLVLTQAMMGVEDIVHDPSKRTRDRVEVELEQVYRAKDELYIRYSVTNLSKTPFRVTTPDIANPLPSVQPISLQSLRNHQVSPQTLAQFKTKPGSKLAVHGDSMTHDLAPGEKTTGVISVRHGADNPPQVFQLNFGADQSGPLTVQAVL